ncbi:MAG: DedA family protein [Prevotella sp.]|nr:DedA family protein [Prevotella sp.]
MDFSVYGYWGMLLTAFLAGSVFPFSSEAVMLGLLASPDIDAWTLVIYATVGNALGGMFNYCVGRLGKLEWIERWLKISPEKMERAQRFMAGRGAWMGFFAFVPILGSAITVTLGLMRANVVISLVSMTIGKLLRYCLLAFGVGWIFN